MNRPATCRVTVVIPVFNNWKVVSACIASCREHIAHDHSVLIVDDASTDPDIGKRIEHAIEGAPNFTYVRNPSNVGFVRTCNRAVLELEKTDNDVLLLNSDTVVTAGFLEEMLGCLYASERHAACSPRTDDASILTFPQMKGVLFTVKKKKRYACWKALHSSLPRFSVLPTGVGFCILIRRSIIRRFGLFDEAYGRGYNEENDFCCRISRHGYSTVVAHHAFVFHDLLGSFGKHEHSILEKRNRSMLDTRYPEYERRVHMYQFQGIQAAEHFANILQNSGNRPTVVYDISYLSVAHNGASLYAIALLRELWKIPDRPYDLCVLALQKHDEFFRLSDEGIPVNVKGIDLPCDLAFVPHQIFHPDQLYSLNRLAVRLAVNLHDVIAFRCNHLVTSTIEMCLEQTIRFFEGLVTISETSRHDIQAYVSGFTHSPDQLFSVIHHGMELPALAASLSEDEEAMIPKEPFLLVMGNAFAHKNMEDALRSVPPSLPTVVIGTVNDSEKERASLRILQSGKLSVDVVRALYERCHMLLFPSNYEGWGLPVLEAGLRGKHVIVSELAVYDEMEKVFPLTGLVHRCKNTEEIMPLLQEVWRLPRQTPRQNFRSWKDSAIETDGFLRMQLKKKINTRKLQERFTTLQNLEHEHHTMIESEAYTSLLAYCTDLKKNSLSMHAYCTDLQKHCKRHQENSLSLHREVSWMRQSRSWKLTAALRALRSWKTLFQKKQQYTQREENSQ